MSRVKFNVNTEYAYLQNFKILQSKEKSGRVWVVLRADNTSRQTASRNMASIAP
jgi:hypothetical protein